MYVLFRYPRYSGHLRHLRHSRYPIRDAWCTVAQTSVPDGIPFDFKSLDCLKSMWNSSFILSTLRFALRSYRNVLSRFQWGPKYCCHHYSLQLGIFWCRCIGYFSPGLVSTYNRHDLEIRWLHNVGCMHSHLSPCSANNMGCAGRRLRQAVEKCLSEATSCHSQGRCSANYRVLDWMFNRCLWQTRFCGDW